MRNTYLVCYDIRDEKRLRNVFKAMRDFGDHLQYSVFECQFTPVDLAKCRFALGELIHHGDDQVLFIDLGPTEGRGERVITALGQPYSPVCTVRRRLIRTNVRAPTVFPGGRVEPSDARRLPPADGATVIARHWPLATNH